VVFITTQKQPNPYYDRASNASPAVMFI